MTSPPYLVLGVALKIDCAKCAKYRKVTFVDTLKKTRFLTGLNNV